MEILLADDHDLYRQGCKLVIQQLDPEATILEARDFDEALAIVKRHKNLDLCLVALVMPRTDEAASLRGLREVAPDVPVVVISAHEDPYRARDALNAGVSGFIPKSVRSDVFLNALKLVLAGGSYFPPELISSTRTHAGARTRGPGVIESGVEYVTGLTPRQTEVLRCLVAGHTNREIAKRLGLAEGTVKAHVSAIFRTLGVRSRTQALRAAANLDMLKD